MINVDFYSFSKRKNSTKKPTGTAHTVSVSFKEETELERPTIEVHDSTITGYNYAYIAYTGRYYWVSGKRSIAKDTYEVDLVEDYLASHIDGVRGQNVYCAMSSVDYDEQIDDARVVPVPLAAEVESAHCGFDLFFISGGKPTVNKYASVISPDGLFDGLEIVTSWEVGHSYITDASTPSVYKDIKEDMGGGDPMDYICEVWQSPLFASKCHSVSTNRSIEVGGKTYNDVNAIASLQPIRHTDVIMLPLPSYNDFRFSERFVSYYLMLPFIGCINIPVDLVRQSSHLLNITYAGDVLSGQITIGVYLAGVCLGVYGTILKTPLPLNKQSTNVGDIIVQGVSGAAKGAVAGAATGGGWGAIAGAFGGAIGGGVKGAITGDKVEKVSASAGALSILALYENVTAPTVIMIAYDSNVDPASLAAVSGRPCHKVVTVKNGYMQTVNASLSFAGTDGEINEVNNAFNGGVYVE